MSEPITIDPAESLPITFDFTDELLEGVTVSGVTFSGSGLTLGTQSNDYANGLSTIVVSGTSHGTRYSLEATGTLSTGAVVNRAAAILGWNK